MSSPTFRSGHGSGVPSMKLGKELYARKLHTLVSGTIVSTPATCSNDLPVAVILYGTAAQSYSELFVWGLQVWRCTRAYPHQFRRARVATM